MLFRFFGNLKRRYKKNSDPIGYARSLGVKIGSRCRLVGDVNFGSEPYLISIGDHVSITSSAFVTHDGGVWVFRDEEPDIDVFKPISIGNNVFIGANCTIMPGTKINNNVVVGAGSVVLGNLESNCVYAGVPVKKIKCLEDYRVGLDRGVFRTKKMGLEEKKKALLNHFFGMNKK